MAFIARKDLHDDSMDSLIPHRPPPPPPPPHSHPHGSEREHTPPLTFDLDGERVREKERDMRNRCVCERFVCRGDVCGASCVRERTFLLRFLFSFEIFSVDWNECKIHR